MSDAFAAGGGFAAEHGVTSAQAHCVTPGCATDTRFNTIRAGLHVVACWRLNHVLFDFDSSVVMPGIKAEIARLAPIVQRHPDAPASIFGHADPVGDDDYNHALSGRRAKAIYALLTRRVDLWEELYAKPHKGDTWGTRSIQLMLQHLEASPGKPLYAGPIDGIAGSGTVGGLQTFQTQSGLPKTGKADEATRAALFRAYMDALADPLVMEPTRFLGQGADPGGKGDYQGCSEFNPVLRLSRADEQRFARGGDTTQRNEQNAPNRRVMLFLYRPGTRVPLERWPCPRAGEGVEACKKQFWPDGAARRDAKEEERHYRVTRDTFACRFYDRFARLSPCEGIVKPMLRIHLFDLKRELVLNATWSVSTPDLPEPITGVAEDGVAVVHNIPVPTTCTVQWSRPPAPGAPPRSGHEFELELFVDLADKDKEESARRRLSNLGHVGDTLPDMIKAFQRAHGKEPTGRLEDVDAELRMRHDRCEPRPKPAPGPGS